MEQAEGRQKTERPTRGSFFFLFLVFLAAVGLGQFASHLAFAPMPRFENYAFAFSLPLPGWSIYLIYLLVVAAMLGYVIKHFRRFSFIVAFAWTLVFAGAVSNIGERIILGYVRDWIYITLYKWTGVYNLADGYIIIGIILLLLSNARVIDKNDKI